MEPNNQPKTNRTFVLTSILLVLGFIAALLILKQLGTKQHVTLQATNGSATISVLPASITLPPNSPMQVWVTADKPVAFVRATVTFDPTKLALIENPLLSTDKLSRVIQQSNMTDANSGGKYIFVLGLDPSQRGNPPTGTFQLATLKFTKKTSQPNVETTVAISSPESSIVDSAAVPCTITANSSTVRINPVSATPNPTVSPSSTPTLAPGQPTPTAGAANPSNMDGNTTVDIIDYTLFMQYWWETNIQKADLNHDGKIDAIDYTIFMNGWYEYHH